MQRRKFNREYKVEAVKPVKERMVSELKTTFASHYTRVVSLQEVLLLDNIAV
jgi:hypothetical protein